MLDDFPVTCKTFEMMVSESNEPTFLYRITDGLHLKSWGSYCAKLAGVPEKIISRSEQIGKLLDQKKFVPPLAKESTNTTIQEDAFVEAFLAADLEQAQSLPALFSMHG